MADLDDFFAKKDRKKGKSVKKFSTPEELVKKIEDTKQKNEQKVRKERQPGQGQEGEDGAPMPGDEDEWREYEVAKKDYTGLKIQPLALTDNNQGGNSGGGSQNNEGGNSGQQGGGGGGSNKPGPWNKADGVEPSPTPAPAPAPVAPPPVATLTPSLAKRLAQAAAAATGEPIKRGQKVHAPDIHNEEYFPSLGGEKKGGSGSGSGGAWTEAGGGGSRVRAPPSGLQPPREVPLGNRFTSLTNDS